MNRTALTDPASAAGQDRPPELGRRALLSRQAARLRELLAEVLPTNGFYARKLEACGLAPADVLSLETFTRRFPFTTKAELMADQLAAPPYGTNLTYPPGRYTRCHQTSGTTGTPLRWLDTPEAWDGMLESWLEVYRAAGVTSQDRLLFAFSFGPFIGFWLAFEAAERLGALCLPGGGMSGVARLRMMFDHRVTVLCCTPTYALRLAEVAEAEGLDLARAAVRTIIVAGEPGGSVPATRQRLERLWRGARVFDHHGLTEAGPVTYECPARPRALHVIESACLAELIVPATGQPAVPGQTAELVLTTLSRTGSPLLRYRTGDLVRSAFDPHAADQPACACGRYELTLEGGIQGRLDDMVIVRGVNVFPSAVEDIVRRFPEVAEYQVVFGVASGLQEMVVRIEPAPGRLDTAGLVRRLEQAFDVALALRVPVVPVPPGTLPRFEMKAGRWLKPPPATEETVP